MLMITRQRYLFGALGISANTDSPDYWHSQIEFYASKWPEIQQKRLKELEAGNAKIAYWRSNAEGLACNHETPRNMTEINVPRVVGMVEQVSGKISICTNTCLHASMKPTRWGGSRTWLVALIGDVIGDDDKMGAQTREIIGECLE